MIKFVEDYEKYEEKVARLEQENGVRVVKHKVIDQVPEAYIAAWKLIYMGPNEDIDADNVLRVITKIIKSRGRNVKEISR